MRPASSQCICFEHTESGPGQGLKGKACVWEELGNFHSMLALKVIQKEVPLMFRCLGHRDRELWMQMEGGAFEHQGSRVTSREGFSALDLSFLLTLVLSPSFFLPAIFYTHSSGINISDFPDVPLSTGHHYIPSVFNIDGHLCVYHGPGSVLSTCVCHLILFSQQPIYIRYEENEAQRER